MSYASNDVNTFALEINKFSSTILDQDPLEGGNHYIYPWTKLIVYE